MNSVISTGDNYTKDTSSSKSRIYILLTSTWNILRINHSRHRNSSFKGFYAWTTQFLHTLLWEEKASVLSLRKDSRQDWRVLSTEEDVERGLLAPEKRSNLPQSHTQVVAPCQQSWCLVYLSAHDLPVDGEVNIIKPSGNDRSLRAL